MRHRSVLIAAICLTVIGLCAPGLQAAESPKLTERLQSLIGRISGKRLPADFATANGRIEAEQVLVATKFAGRVREVLVDEGQTVEAGQVIARMDTADLQTQLAGAEAQVRRAEKAALAAEAAITQRASELALAHQEFDRAAALNQKGYGTTQQLDQRRSQLAVSEAAGRAAQASLDEAHAAIDAARAEVAHIRSQLDDAELKSPRRGRVEYKLVRSGEVIAAGAPVVTVLDLSDVTMTVFVPARVAGRLTLGDEARIRLDPAPDFVVPVTVSFVAADAQFTPKAVETADERDKLMFRVKLRIAPTLLRQFESRVKTGVRGIAYLRTSTTTAWPSDLAAKLPK